MDRVTNGQIKIFACNANRELAANIARGLGSQLGQAEVSTFSDGEIKIKINETVRNSDVFIIQPTSPPVNEHLMELLIMIDACKRASAGRITAVMPYFGYARQDRKARARDPISSKLVANLITTAGADRVLTMDLHCAQIQGFFDIPLDHLVGVPLLCQYYKEKFQDSSDLVAVSPDLGSVARTRNFADKMDIPLAIVDKRRPKENESEVMNIIGDVEGKRVILVDDIIDTAGTITKAAEALKKHGAVSVYACCTHPVLSGPAIVRIEQSVIEELVALNTVELSEKKQIEKIKTVSVASLFSVGISRIHEGLPISVLFN